MDHHAADLARLPFAGAQPFFSYFVEWPSGELTIQIRFSADGQNWTPWYTLLRDDHFSEKRMTTLQIGDPAHRYYELRAAGEALATAKLHFYYPGPTVLAQEMDKPGEARDLFGCPCPLPEYQRRAQWCPAGNCGIVGTPVPTTVTHLIVHHTAGPNDLTDWAAYMRAVWDYHVNGRGWDDIGYNWLIDPNGVIYQGRGDNIRGAHFCGNNTGTMGVAMMGNFTAQAPSIAALTALESLLAWKSCDRELDPLTSALHASSGRNLRHISGHRDGCATSCPGDQFYPLFGQLRQAVDNYISNNCALTGPLVLSSTTINDSTFQLNWVYTGEATIDSFYLEKAVGGRPAPFNVYQILPALVTTFTEADLERDGIFRYRIRARTTQGDTTEYSNLLVINTTVVGLEEYRLAEEAVQLSPNPVIDEVTINLRTPVEGELELQLFSAAGQLCRRVYDRKQGAVWTGTYHWSDLPGGLYFLRVRIGNSYGLRRLLIL